MGVVIPSIPYKSQYDPDAEEFRNDCGPASLAMILRGYGINVSTNAVYRKTGSKPNYYVSVSQLMRAAQSYGVPFEYFYNWEIENLKGRLDDGYPVIVLVHYGGWSQINPGVSTQNTFKGPHFVVVVGYDDDHIYVNDPLWKENRRSEGYRKAWTHEQFYAAWDSNHEDGNRDRSGIVSTRALPTRPHGSGEWSQPSIFDLEPQLLLRMLAWADYFGVPRPDLDKPASLNAYRSAMGRWGERIARHIVDENDDLGLLALKYYGDPLKWKVILTYNGLTDGDTIHDGDLLLIPEPLESPVRVPLEELPRGGTFRHDRIQKEEQVNQTGAK